jgi:allophanate hydrolase subunit 2
MIGVVDEAALPLLAQVRPGSRLRFTPSESLRTPA